MNKVEYFLTCLNKECSEIIKDCSKALRFGLNDKSPCEINGDTKIQNELA